MGILTIRGHTALRIVASYSFNKGEEFIESNHAALLAEVREIIAGVGARQHKTKSSKEKTMTGRMLYSPTSLNRAFKAGFTEKDWTSAKIECEYPTEFYTGGYKPKILRSGAFREMDFLKGQLGIEVQFGKYAFMVYNGCAKMTIFKKRGFIDAAVEIVPIKEFADQMSTGVSYFEQFAWDLKERGVADIDVPVLILGIHSEEVR